MSVYSAAGRNPPSFMTLIRATQCANTLRAFVPSLLKSELWINNCQHKLRSNGKAVYWRHHQLHPGTRLCRRQQPHSYTQSQEQKQMRQQSSDELTRYSSPVSVIKESVSRTVLCKDQFHHQIVQQTSLTVTITTPFKFALAYPETISMIHPFYDQDNTQIALEINSTHEVQPLTKNLARRMYISLRLPIWLSMRNRFYHTGAVVQAGHNKWSKVKHKKKVTDLEKSTTIHKYVTLIASAIKVGGGPDPDSNIRLAGIIESARKAGVPKASIENTIKKSSSKGTDSASSELVVYDAQGPSGYHMIIEAFTQNNRKTRPEIKNLLTKYSGILLEPGSSAFMFDHKGVIRVPQREFDTSTDPLEVAIEVGAEDVQCDRDSEGSDSASNLDGATDNEGIGEEQLVRFLCNPSELSTVSKALKSLGYVVAGASLEYVPKSFVHLSQGSYDSAVRLVCALSEHSDVTEVYDNFALQLNPRK